MNLTIPYQVLKLLAAETACGIVPIAKALGVERQAVLDTVSTLRGLGVPVEFIEPDGFQLTEALDLLDTESILSGMDSKTRHQIAGLNIEASLASTNSSLQSMPADRRHAQVLLAEHQSSGRGRRGRSWVSPFARNLYLSMGWQFQLPASELSCLPLVVALSSAKALARAGLDGHRVKWPNDLLLDGRKLSGCLVEMQSGTNGACHAVLGVGINVNMPQAEFTRDIDQPWTDLCSRLPGVSRNSLAAWLLDALISDLMQFEARGFEPFRARWRQLDCLSGQSVEVDFGDRQIRGEAVGIDENGALLLRDGERTLRLHSGEVSLRKTPV
jgi:BirA family biotin operon repressor/biotin-[acetyl-CoA-carboxylase] ligase